MAEVSPVSEAASISAEDVYKRMIELNFPQELASRFKGLLAIKIEFK